MKRTDFPALRESVYDGVLPNGCRIRVIPKAGFYRKYAFYAVDFGSIDTEFSVNGKKLRVADGIAHYLEHKMFDMPYGDAMNRFAAFGGNPNAFTSYDMTAYYVECTEHFEENLRTLLEFVSLAYFSEKSVEKERGIIAQEIRMYEDSPSSRVFENLVKALYAEHPIRVPIAGTVDSIGAITAKDLLVCHETFYAPSNAMLCVVGDVNPDAVFALAGKCLPEKKAPFAERCYGENNQKISRKRTEARMEVSMPVFCAGFKATPRGNAMREEFLGDLTADLLLSASSPLYTRLYEKGLIDTNFSAGHEGVKGVSFLSVSGESKDPDAVIDAILRESERLQNEGLDAHQFARMKKSTLGRLVRSLDDFDSICSRSCAYAFYGDELFSFPEIFAALTQQDVLEFLRDCVREETCVRSVILPIEKEASL